MEIRGCYFDDETIKLYVKENIESFGKEDKGLLKRYIEDEELSDSETILLGSILELYFRDFVCTRCEALVISDGSEVFSISSSFSVYCDHVINKKE